MALDFPNSPSVGAVFTNAGTSWIWDGTKWAQGPQAPPLVTMAPTPPASPAVGSLWWDENGGLLYVYYNDGNSSQWVVANGNGAGLVGPQGPTGPTGSIGPSGPVGGINPNKLINPFHEIDQQNEGAAITVGSTWNVTDGMGASWTSTGGTATAARNPGPPGYPYSTVFHVNTAAPSVGASDNVQLQHRVEQEELIDTGFGTASALPLTLQFWAMDTIGGKRCLAIYSNTLVRLFVAEFTCTAGLWQLHTITIPGDTAGTWQLYGNGIGFYICWVLATGGARQGATANVWQTVSSNTLYATSLDNAFALTTNAWFYLGPYKLEVGNQATPILRQSFDYELARCQRRYEKSYAPGVLPGDTSGGIGGGFWGEWYGANLGSSNPMQVGHTYYYKVPKRASPTVTLYSPVTGATGKFRDGNNNADVAASVWCANANYFGWYAPASITTNNVLVVGHMVADSRL